MFLTDEEKAMAAGERGPGVQKCMDILIKFGDAFGAEKMAPLSSAHTMPKEPLELLYDLTKGVERTGAFTTLHALMSSFSPKTWEAMGIPESFAAGEMELFEKRQAVYRRAGFYQTYTCLPMLAGNFPRKGQFISWIGSGAQLLANSLMGAKCNRDGTVINLAAAITGRAPYLGLFLDENRYARALVKLEGLKADQLSLIELGAMGYYVGARAGLQNVVMDGLPPHLDLDQLKYLLAPLSVSGSVSLCHIVGLTPEAPTLEAALNRKKPGQTIVVDQKALDESLSQYAGNGRDVDMVIFGCPHCTITEIMNLAGSLENRTIDFGKRLWIGAPFQSHALARQMGLAGVIEKAGGVFASACMASIPDAPIPEGVREIGTNSFKAAHYITRLTKGAVNVRVGNMETCIRAITGGKWEESRC